MSDQNTPALTATEWQQPKVWTLAERMQHDERVAMLESELYHLKAGGADLARENAALREAPRRLIREVDRTEVDPEFPLGQAASEARACLPRAVPDPAHTGDTP